MKKNGRTIRKRQRERASEGKITHDVDKHVGRETRGETVNGREIEGKGEGEGKASEIIVNKLDFP